MDEENQNNSEEREEYGPNLSLRPAQMVVIAPEEDRRILVTEDQLDVLCNRSKDAAFEWCLFSGGAALGLMQNVFRLIEDVVKSNTPGAWDVLASLLFAGFAAASFAKYTQHRQNRTQTDEYAAKLKAGRVVNVA